MSWLYYLLEANLYLAAFYLLYKLLLQNTTFYHTNRYFLVLSIMLAFTIPLMQLGFLKPPLEIPTTIQLEEVPQQFIEVVTADEATTWSLNDYLLYGYLALAIGLTAKFLFSISKIIRLYFNHQKRELGKYTLVELSTEHAAFSFFNVLFIHPNMVKNNAVLTHEMIHIKQKHSLDIILLELLKIICWFNPVVYLMKRDLTLLHEYIADESTTAKDISKHEYAMFLIENSMASYSPSLVNQFFNQSILKSRINMLNKEKTAKWARLKYLLAVPLGVGLLCASTLSFSKSYGYLEIGAQKEIKPEVVLKQEKKTYYPKYKHDKDGNYISLEERLIVVNGKIITDKNKYYGTAEADKIIFLNSTDATKKYGTDKGKNGAVELYGEKAVFTFPPPVVKSAAKHSETPALSPNPPKIKKDQVKLPPPAIENPPKGKKLKKFPPTIVKADEKNKTAAIKEVRIKGIEGKPTQIVEGIKIEERRRDNEPETLALRYEKYPQKKVEGIKLEKSKSETIKGEPIELEIKAENPTKKVQGLKLEEVKGSKPKEVKSIKIEATETPTKKVQGVKIGKAKSPAKTTTKIALSQQLKTGYNGKAWLLYKPQPVEDKNDRC